MQGWLRAAAVVPTVLEPEHGEDYGDDSDDHLPPRLLTALRRALEQLPEPQRTLVLELQAGKSAAHLARRYRTSSRVVTATAQQMLRWLNNEVTAVLDTVADLPLDHAQETAMPKRSNPLTPPPLARIRCIDPACRHPVSTRAPARPELAGYCSLHRRRLARDNDGLAALGAYLPTDPLLPPTASERAIAERLLSSRAPGQEIVQITPGIAVVLLEHNGKNRRLNTSRVDVYARDMLAGAWQQNYQGIALCDDRTLADGQHRLSAVVRARRPVLMTVAFGLPPSVRHTLDQGRSRSLVDTLRIVDNNPHAGRIVRWFNAIDHLVSGRPKPLSRSIIQRQLERYDASVSWFLELSLRKPFNRPALVGALLYAHRVLPDDVTRFTTRYASGSDLPSGSPILTLRDYAISATDKGRVIGLKTLRCVLAEIRGERLERLYSSEEGLQHFHRLHQTDTRDRAEPSDVAPPRRLRSIG